MSMSEYTPRRLKSGKIKADQLKATGAKYVVTSCHNCVDGLTDVIRHYKLDMKVTQLVNLVAEALVKLDVRRSCLLTLAEADEALFKSARNIPDVTVRTAAELNAYDVATRQKMLVTREAMDVLLEKAA